MWKDGHGAVMARTRPKENKRSQELPLQWGSKKRLFFWGVFAVCETDCRTRLGRRMDIGT